MAEDEERQSDPLEQKAAWIDHLLQDVDEDAFSGDEREISGEASVVDQHEADIANVVYEREQEETMRQVFQRDAAQIEDARKRRAEGTYGICEDCGKPIPAARLQAMPEATRCVECQRRREAARTPPDRPDF
jgi:DnaK suppressor protein